MSDTTSSLRARGIVEASAAAGAIALVLALFGARALSGEERYSVLVPDGLAFSEFKGYEGLAGCRRQQYRRTDGRDRRQSCDDHSLSVRHS